MGRRWITKNVIIFLKFQPSHWCLKHDFKIYQLDIAVFIYIQYSIYNTIYGRYSILLEKCSHRFTASVHSISGMNSRHIEVHGYCVFIFRNWNVDSHAINRTHETYLLNTGGAYTFIIMFLNLTNPVKCNFVLKDKSNIRWGITYYCV